jgi:hypothetical protein
VASEHASRMGPSKKSIRKRPLMYKKKGETEGNDDNELSPLGNGRNEDGGLVLL